MLFIALVRLTSGFFVYLFIILGIVGFTGFGVYMLVNAGDPYSKFSPKRNMTLSIILGVAAVMVAVLIFFLFCCFRRRVHMAFSIIKVSINFIKTNYWILLSSFVLLGCLLVFLGLWLFLLMCYMSLTATNPSSPA